MNICAKKVLTAVAFVAGILSFTSCENELTITAGNAGVDFEYKIGSGAAFLNIISASGDDELVFDPAGIKAVFEEALFENVSAESSEGGNLDVKGSLSGEAADPFSKSGMISLKGKTTVLKLTKEGMVSLYESLPEELQNYLDMFMAPTFSGEEMSDEEYIELIAEVYGQELADEINKANIKLVLKGLAGTEKKQTVQLLRLLNMNSEIVLKA